MELQETLLEAAVDDIMDTALAQEIKTMMHWVATVHRPSKVVGGTTGATFQTLMVSTMVDHTHPTPMVSTGTHGRDTTTLSNSLR